VIVCALADLTNTHDHIQAALAAAERARAELEQSVSGHAANHVTAATAMAAATRRHEEATATVAALEEQVATLTVRRATLEKEHAEALAAEARERIAREAAEAQLRYALWPLLTHMIFIVPLPPHPHPHHHPRTPSHTPISTQAAVVASAQTHAIERE
jgi:hypothetical protein